MNRSILGAPRRAQRMFLAASLLASAAFAFACASAAVGCGSSPDQNANLEDASTPDASSSTGGGGAGGKGGGGAGGGGGGGGGGDAWLDVDWPTTSVDPIAAGKALFDDALESQWRLTLKATDTICPASDCPGGAPDPVLPPGYEVASYTGAFDLGYKVGATFPLRQLYAGKASVSTTGMPDVGRAVAVQLFLRAADGALMILTESEWKLKDGTFNARDDFGTFVLQRDAKGTRIVMSPPPFLPDSPTTADEKLALELHYAFAADGTLTFRTGGKSVSTAGYAFKASERQPAERASLGALADELADPKTTTTRALQIYDELTNPLLDTSGIFAALDHVAHHPVSEVRSAALAYVVLAYLDPDLPLSRRFMDDRMMAQLLYDPAPALRLAAVAAQKQIRASWTVDDYHCAVEQALTRCAQKDADAAVQSACSSLLSSLGPSYGQCPFPWP